MKTTRKKTPSCKRACRLQLSEAHREDIVARMRGEIWTFYSDLKAFKDDPQDCDKATLEQRFDAIFTQNTSFATLDQLPKRIHSN